MNFFYGGHWAANTWWMCLGRVLVVLAAFVLPLCTRCCQRLQNLQNPRLVSINSINTVPHSKAPIHHSLLSTTVANWPPRLPLGSGFFFQCFQTSLQLEKPNVPVTHCDMHRRRTSNWMALTAKHHPRACHKLVSAQPH